VCVCVCEFQLFTVKEIAATTATTAMQTSPQTERRDNPGLGIFFVLADPGFATAVVLSAVVSAVTVAMPCVDATGGSDGAEVDATSRVCNSGTVVDGGAFVVDGCPAVAGVGFGCDFDDVVVATG